MEVKRCKKIEYAIDFLKMNGIIIYMQIWSIGMTLASQAGKAGPTPVICFFSCLEFLHLLYPHG